MGELQSSPFGADWYYYFYNWQVETPNLECASERIPVNITLQDPNSLNELPTAADWTVQPNPNAGSFTVAFSRALPTASQLQLYNSQGQLLQNITIGSGQQQVRIDLQHAAKGLYFLQWNGVVSKKVVVE